MAKPLMLTENPDYFRSYFIKSHPVKHHGRCQSPICIRAREDNRIHPGKRYGKSRYCSACETPFKLSDYRCPCCGHILRKRSKYAKTKELQVTRY